MKKTVKKIVTGTLLLVITFISGIITLVLYPQPLFAHQLEYENFKVYSNNQISPDIKVILDHANSLVTESELKDSSYKYDIFLSHNSLYNSLHDKLLGRGPSAKAIDNNVVVKVDIDLKRNLAFPTFHENCELDLSYLIAHEMLHCLQANKYGKMKFNPFRHPEIWKLEGYPEYVSKQLNKKDNYYLVNEINRYIKLQSKSKGGWILPGNGSCSVPDIYYKSGLMMKYLIDVKHCSYDKILNDTASENTIYDEMIEWKHKVKVITN